MPNGGFAYTVFDSKVTLQFGIQAHFLSASFNGWGLVNDTGSPAFNGVTVAFADVPGFEASRVSFDATQLWLNVEDLIVGPGQSVQVDLQFATPEPVPIALLGLGIGTLAVLRHLGLRCGG